MSHSKPSWGLVLSGGTACGFANIGVLEVLEENNLKPDYIAGSSMGAVVASLYALGFSAKKIHKIAIGIPLNKLAKISKKPFKDGLHGGLLRQGIQDYLEPFLGNKTIGDCTIPFVCVAGKIREPVSWIKILESGFHDYIRGCVTPYIFGKNVPIADAIMASSAMPIIFSPIQIEKSQYVDMIVFGSIPARSLHKTYHPDILIATDTNQAMDDTMQLLPKGWSDFLREGLREQSKSKEICDLIIKPELPYPQYRFDKAEEFIQAGRTATIPLIPSILKLINI
ncbi:MAG: patatin-like phospholipase family protein [Candidatus Peribacteraceae bacterium]|nr:patatin-like phospholipase family protein [Candidatus Peribacteraceae bacterium]